MESTSGSFTNRQRGHPYTTDEIETILFPSDTTKAFGTDTSTDLCREIKRLKKKQVDLELHGQTLSEYYRNKKIPRGFRIYNQPTIGRNKREFCDKWCEVATQSSLNFMLLVIEEVKVQLFQVNREIAAIEITLQEKSTNKEALSSDIKKIEGEVTTYSDKQQQIKRDKLRQVNLDYHEGRVYPWLTGETRGRMKNYPKRRTAYWQRRTGKSSSSSERPTENPSSESDSNYPDNTGAYNRSTGFPLAQARDAGDPGGDVGARNIETRSHSSRGRPPRKNQ